MIMALSDNPFLGDDLTQLAESRELYRVAINELVTTGQNYTVQGRSFAFSDIDKIKETYRQIKEAINYAQGRVVTSAYPYIRTLPETFRTAAQ